jgi:hypothetical protein
VDEPGAMSNRAEAAAFERVQLLIETRRPADALRVAQEALRNSPADPTLTAAVGWASLAAGDVSAARTWIERALALNPNEGWIQNLYAHALLNEPVNAAEARTAAQRAVELDPHDASYLYTLVRACLSAKDRTGAEQAATAIRRTSPGTHLGPLAEALIELDRGRVYRRTRYSVGGVIALVVLTRGLALLVFGIGWIIRAMRRAPHLRRADALLHEALRLRPDSAPVRSVASEVLRLRFRFAQAVDYEVAAAAIDAGLVDGDELVTSIARRTAGFIGVGWFCWIVTIVIVDRFVDRHPPVAVTGLFLALTLVAAISRFERWQTRSLPTRLVRDVRARWVQSAAAGLSSAVLVLAGSAYLGGDGDDGARGYQFASLVSSPIAVVCALALTARLIVSRRTEK